MGKTVIIADSTCDLPKELRERYNIHILPLRVHLGEQEYLDGTDISPAEIYTWAQANNTVPKTSAITIYDATKEIYKALQSADEVICFTIAQGMSSCYSVMNMAAEELDVTDRVFVIDSKSLSTGIAIQIIEAAVMAEKGFEAKEIVKRIKELQPHIYTGFVVDTLKYLHMGGRCSSIEALAGSTLRLHPHIYLSEGKMKVGKKYHGKMDKVIGNYVRDIMPVLCVAVPDRVFITHSGCRQEILQSVQQQITDMNYFREIYVCQAGSVISSHCGPGALGVMFVEKA